MAPHLGQDTGQDPRQADISALQSAIATYLDAHFATERFMGAVLVGRRGEILFSQGYGMANLEHSVPNTTQTKFRLASLTKQFTAAAILQLQAQGLLDVQAAIATYLPDYPNGDRITIHQLLNHTAGIPNYTAFPDYATQKRLSMSVAEVVAWFKDKPLEFETGDQHRYSNSGYTLLTHILETVSEQPYAEYVRSHLFEPLGMTSSGYDTDWDILPHRASGYDLTDTGYGNAEFIDMSVPTGAGGLYSTVEDLYKWDQALDTEAVLGDRAKAQMFAATVPVSEAGEKVYYGYGWIVAEQLGRKHITHGGGIDGFCTIISRYPDDQVTVIVLSNVSNAAVAEIGAGLAAIAFGEPYKLPKVYQEVAIDPAIYAGYVGEYQLAPEKILAITAESDQLLVQLTGQGKLKIYPTSPTHFFLRIVDAQLTFEVDEQGQAQKVTLHQSGQDLPAPRMPQ
ncbi:serine hydrolase [Trichocoleus desertorum AS-A10]|uniref:serine hydrolase n=1 Tax=Trichocoleus desertorum TaxID=1481672 RepID=UPI00329A170C